MASTEVKIVIVGPNGVGKSSLAIMYTQSFFVDEYDPTIEDSHRKHVQINSENYLLDILDTAGEEQFSLLRDQVYKAGQGFLFVYSVTCRSSLNELEKLIERVVKVKDTENVPMIIAGNKCDLDDDRQLSPKDGKLFATKFNSPFFETSAKCRINVSDIFEGVVLRVEGIPLTPEKKWYHDYCVIS